MFPTCSLSADIEEDLCRRAGATPTNPYNALPPNATLNNPKLTLNTNNTPNPGVKFGSTTFSTQYSNPSGKLDPVAFDPASMVMKIPAAMNANVDIPNPTFKKSIDDDEWGDGNEVVDAVGCTNPGRLRRRHRCCSCDVEEREPVNDNDDIDGRRDATKENMTVGDFMVLVDRGESTACTARGQGQSGMAMVEVKDLPPPPPLTLLNE
ncbi:hypothetical protein ACHAXH_003497 [Discostella pseudostelligera]